MLTQKCVDLLKHLKTQADEASSAMGFIKWVVQIDPLAHEVLYNVTEDETKIEDAYYDVKKWGSLFMCLQNIVHVDILSEDYIRQLVVRYNHTKNDRTQGKVETMCFKTHHLVFYHMTDILRLVSYLCFKTPSITLLHHFACDKQFLSVLKDLFSEIWDVLGTADTLEYYQKVLTSVEKRVKGVKNNDENILDWVMNRLTNTPPYDQVNDDEEDKDSEILEGDSEGDGCVQDEEDMYIILSNINDSILSFITTLSDIFILHGKNTEIIDFYAALNQVIVQVTTKKVEFKNMLEDAELLQKSKVVKNDIEVNTVGLMTVREVVPVLDIKIDQTQSDHSTPKNLEQAEFYYSHEFDKLCDLVFKRIDEVSQEYSELDSDQAIPELCEHIKTIYEGVCMTSGKSGADLEPKKDVKSAFKKLLKYSKPDSSRRLLKQYSNFVYPAYGFIILQRYLKSKLLLFLMGLLCRGWYN